MFLFVSTAAAHCCPLISSLFLFLLLRLLSSLLVAAEFCFGESHQSSTGSIHLALFFPNLQEYKL